MGLRGLLRGVFDHRSELWAATEGQDDALESLSAALAAELGWRGQMPPVQSLAGFGQLARNLEKQQLAGPV